MASVCMPPTNYQQQQHHFQMMNGNIMLLQQQHQQQTQQQHLHHQYANKQLAIAPAPTATASTKVLGNSNLQNIQASAAGGFGPMLAKKKYTYANVPYGEQLPSVARRNARERNRVKQVNNGFANLRQHLPQTVVNALSNGGRGASKKLSKVDTLRIAVEYIRGLQDLLDDSDCEPQSSQAALHFDESSSDAGSNYAYSSIGSPEEPQFQLTHAYHSEISASPTPSFSDSDISIGGANYLQPPKLEEPQQQQHQQQQPQQQQQQELQFKFEPFDNYGQLAAEDDDQPDDDDDEELLDYISSWQEQ